MATKRTEQEWRQLIQDFEYGHQSLVVYRKYRKLYAVEKKRRVRN